MYIEAYETLSYKTKFFYNMRRFIMFCDRSLCIISVKFGLPFKTFPIISKVFQSV